MRVANVVLNDFTRDNRVLKVSKLLSQHGTEVRVVALLRPGLAEFETHPTGFSIHRIRIISPQRSAFAPLKWLELVVRIASTYRTWDVWHCNDAEAFAIGLLAKWLRPELKLIYDCHEFESERNGKPAWYSRFIRKLEERFIHRAEEVVVVSPSIEMAYRKRYTPRGMRRISLVRNVPEASHRGNAVGTPLRSALGLANSDFVAIYQGALTINRGIETLIELGPKISGSNIHLVFMGYGMLEPMVLQAAQMHPNVHFQPAVPYDEVLSYTADADVGLVSVKPVCLSYLYCLPNKLFESINAGIPVLTNPLPDCAAILHHYGIGETVSTDDADHWFETLERVSKKEPAWKVQAQAGLMAAQQDLNWEKESMVLLGVYQRVGLTTN